jgi:hypothetical protein
MSETREMTPDEWSGFVAGAIIAIICTAFLACCAGVIAWPDDAEVVQPHKILPKATVCT